LRRRLRSNRTLAPEASDSVSQRTKAAAAVEALEKPVATLVA
jgi:hypothetical protein